MIVSIVCALLAFGVFGWYFVSAKTLDKKSADLIDQIAQKDAEILEANTLSDRTDGKTVEGLSSEIYQSMKQYQTLLKGKTVWVKLLPNFTQATLKGITISNFSVDEKLTISIEGKAVGYVDENGVAYTSNGLVIRQLSAYREALYTPEIAKSPETSAAGAGAVSAAIATPASGSVATTQAKTEKLFSEVSVGSVVLNGIPSGLPLKFTMTLKLNPNVVSSSASTTVQSTSAGGQ